MNLIARVWRLNYGPGSGDAVPEVSVSRSCTPIFDHRKFSRVSPKPAQGAQIYRQEPSQNPRLATCPKHLHTRGESRWCISGRRL